MTSTPFLSAYSVLRLGTEASGQILFPNRNMLLTNGTAGYVRSTRRAALSRAIAEGRRSLTHPLPWRDYPEELLVPAQRLIGGENDKFGQVLIGARNSLNEFGYQVYLEGHWWRRLGDASLPDDWPVLACHNRYFGITPLQHAQKARADLVTGIPLVIGSQPRQRDFFIAHCSDPAHVFEVHPKGLLGPSHDVDLERRKKANQTLWLKLSEAWQESKDEGLSQTELARRLKAIAKSHGVTPSRNLLHSLVALNDDGELLLFAITGSLDAIARHLVRHWRVRDAILLDNGGSVGWWSRLAGNSNGNLLMSGPNYRSRGLVFINFVVCEFVQPRFHPALEVDTL